MNTYTSQYYYYEYYALNKPEMKFNDILLQFNRQFKENSLISGKDFTLIKQNIKKRDIINISTSKLLDDFKFEDSFLLDCKHIFRNNEGAHTTIRVYGTKEMLLLCKDKNIPVFPRRDI